MDKIPVIKPWSTFQVFTLQVNDIANFVGQLDKVSKPKPFNEDDRNDKRASTFIDIASKWTKLNGKHFSKSVGQKTCLENNWYNLKLKGNIEFYRSHWRMKNFLGLRLWSPLPHPHDQPGTLRSFDGSEEVTQLLFSSSDKLKCVSFRRPLRPPWHLLWPIF